MQQGISMILINLRSQGIKIRPIISIDGAHHLNEVFFEDVIVPAKNIVGEEGRGWDCAKYLLSCERAAIANVGLCEERLSYLHELSEEIFQAGRSIKDDMNLRLTIARLGAEIRALDLTNWRFLLNPDIDKENPGYASILKLKGTELLQEITALLARVSGLSGLERRSTEGQDELHPLAALVPRYLYYRAATIYGGTSEVQKNILAKTILG
jgi:pimeloyl-CoA dehydrogenase